MILKLNILVLTCFFLLNSSFAQTKIIPVKISPDNDIICLRLSYHLQKMISSESDMRLFNESDSIYFQINIFGKDFNEIMDGEKGRTSAISVVWLLRIGDISCYKNQMLDFIDSNELSEMATLIMGYTIDMISQNKGFFQFLSKEER
jgi:hypothetical protein